MRPAYISSDPGRRIRRPREPCAALLFLWQIQLLDGCFIGLLRIGSLHNLYDDTLISQGVGKHLLIVRDLTECAETRTKSVNIILEISLYAQICQLNLENVTKNGSEHDKTNKMTSAPSEDSVWLGFRPVWIWSEPSLSAWRRLLSLVSHNAHSKDWTNSSDLGLCWAARSFLWCFGQLKILNFM